MEHLTEMRLGAAAEISRMRDLKEPLALYREYGEKEAVFLLGQDESSVKRWRRAGLIPYRPLGEKGVRYLGLQICDIYLFGNRAAELWGGTQSENSNSENTGSEERETVPHGSGAGSTKTPDKSDALRLAQQTLKKPRGF
ncbi:hypothetical protein [Jiella pelagia]|uniref:DNA-binding protein n=1 Tax=Jiella pelagia TaxID=2986949 RepID=A0ABY7BZ28_9HYPH|nr:hypothetical protein [Jiella pelagia]WAP69018.1 hypothetical protein OH818_01390 [Jiella pelagia]